VVAGEAALREAVDGEDWHWFRYPYLHEGETPEKRHAVRQFLKRRGYRVAQVRIS
jgi:gamma-glutamyltranspeptidase